jgi:adenylate cyclase
VAASVKRFGRLLALGLIVVLAVALAAGLDAAGTATGVRQFEDFTLDLRQQTTAESFQPGVGDRESEVALVLFDEFTVMDPVSGWPWISPFPRAHLAALIDALSAAGAKTIGVDVFLDRLYPGLNEIDDGDDLLRAAIERAGNVVLVSPVQQTDEGPVASPPDPYFADVAADVGSAELPSSFETFRDGTLAVRSEDHLEPSFALAMYARSRGFDVDSLLQEARRQGRISLPGLPRGVGTIPEDWLEGGSGSASTIIPFRIRYVGPPSSSDAEGPPGTFQASSSGSIPDMAAVVPDLLADLFRDKTVLLGTGFHEQDRFRTPFFSYTHLASGEEGATGATEPYGWMYGVEVHANALQNMIDGQYVRPMGEPGRILLMLLAAAVTGGVVFWKGTGWGGLATVLALAASGLYAWWAWAGVVYLPGAELFSIGDPFKWVPVGATFLSGILAYVGSVAYVAIFEEREKRFIKGAFGKYVSPEVVNRISRDPAALKLGGQSRPLTLLFSDLAGFTTMSERMAPERLLTLLNEYLEDMTAIVLEEGGTLDKYIGDAIMAFWNAPEDVEDHADRAIRTAVTMQRRMSELNRRWAEEHADHEPLEVRIGVHTGEVVVGNVGGSARFDYSAIGDSVNLAARLEPANKTYGTLNMVSEIALEAGDAARYRVRELDYIAVKGKEKPVKVYELLELAGVELPPEKEEALRHYRKGMEAYQRREWGEAREHFKAALDSCPDDGPSAVYVKRCDDYIASPPPADWDFVVHRTEK